MKQLYVLVACEESQTSCIEFRNLGCISFSCDIQPCSGGHPEWHIQGDVSPFISNCPCTITCEAASFLMSFYISSIKYICVENPRPFRRAGLPSPTCVVSPYMFGSLYSKRTYLWTRNLPPVISTCYNPHPVSFHYTRSGSKNRSKSDPIMYSEIARQFVDFILNDIND